MKLNKNDFKAAEYYKNTIKAVELAKKLIRFLYYNSFAKADLINDNSEKGLKFEIF